MSLVEMFLYGILGVCNLIIASQWGKYGYWEVGIQRPPNKTAIQAMFAGGLAFVGFGLYFKVTGQPLSLNKVAVIIMIGISILWTYFYRCVILAPGLFEFNSARIRMNNWSLSYYVPGEKNSEERGRNLAGLDMAKAAIVRFKKAIVLQGKGQRQYSFQGRQKLNEEDLDGDGLYRIRCLCCPSEVKVPNIRRQKLSGSCSVCGSPLSVLLDGDEALVTTMLLRPVNVVTDGNRCNIAVAYEEMALLYRMMNLFDEAKDALSESKKIVGELLERQPRNMEYLKLMSLIIFRKAEIDHITGQKQAAREGYEESLKIDTGLSDKEGIETTTRLLAGL